MPHEWLVIGVHSKQRELKIEPRLFAMMTLEMRYYFSITEKNIADHFFEYIDQQTMTSSETELTLRLMALTYVMSKNEDPGWVNVIPAYKYWNIRWYYHATYQVFSMLDEIFGTLNLYTYTHEFFQSYLIYLSSILNPPDNLNLDNRLDPPHKCRSLVV